MVVNDANGMLSSHSDKSANIIPQLIKSVRGVAVRGMLCKLVASCRNKSDQFVLR